MRSSIPLHVSSNGASIFMRLSWYFKYTSGNVNFWILAGISKQTFVWLLRFLITLNNFYVFNFVGNMSFGYLSAIATTWFQKTNFLSLVRLAMVAWKGKFRWIFWVPRAALCFMRFPVVVLGVTSERLFRSVSTVLLALLNERVRTCCLDRILGEARFLCFGKQTVFEFVEIAERCMLYCLTMSTVYASTSCTRQVFGKTQFTKLLQ